MPRCLICKKEVSDEDILKGNYFMVVNPKKQPLAFLCDQCYKVNAVERWVSEVG